MAEKYSICKDTPIFDASIYRFIDIWFFRSLPIMNSAGMNIHVQVIVLTDIIFSVILGIST